MNFFKQILAEFKNMLHSKFILISGIAIFAIICIVVPVLVIIESNHDYYTYVYSNYTVTIDGIQVPCGNDFAWEYDYLQSQEEWITDNLTSQESVKYAGDLIDELMDFYGTYAIATMGEDDYRSDMCYKMTECVKENFVLSLTDVDEDALFLALEQVIYDTSYISLLELSDEEKQTKIDENTVILEMYDDLVVNSNLAMYVDLQKESYADDIEDYNEQITLLEESLLTNPSQEDYVSEQIESMEIRIKNIGEIYIPSLDYRLENNIIPNDGSWQDSALNQKDSSLSSIEYTKLNTVTEEEFKEDEYKVEEYETYDKYLAYQDAQILEDEFDLFVAESSLNSGEPDMDFVSDGARANAHNFITASLFIAVFAVLVGGCAISTEFQNGTVRLLMVRPRTREKVLFSRFLAGLMLVYVLYFAIFITTIITNGFMYGFADYLYPNYTASGNVNFFAMFFKELMIISFSMIFLYSFAFAISTIVRNTAVAIIIPTLGILGSFILMQVMYSFTNMDWVSFTPILYIPMYDFFGNYSQLQYLVEKGMSVSVGLGVLILTIYSVISMVIATVIFKKTDITN
ncbi:MAG: ABC transporter permease subunit [Clostridia bacterium]